MNEYCISNFKKFNKLVETKLSFEEYIKWSRKFYKNRITRFLGYQGAGFKPKYRQVGNQLMLETIKQLQVQHNLKNEFEVLFLIYEIETEIQNAYSKLKVLINKVKKEREPLSQQIEEIYAQLLIENKAPAKFYSEIEMYKLIKDYFSDAKLHYSPDFLGKQHYDVYIPSARVAFEYQGKQHYEPVKFFGGEESYQKNIERDDRKWKLSKKNDVTLVYWSFEEPITKQVLIRKLKTNKIK